MKRLGVVAAVVGLAASAGLAGAKGPPGAEAERIARLCKELGETQYGSEGACKQLIAIGEPAMPALLKALKDRRPQARWWAVVAVCCIGADEGYPAVVAALRNDASSYVRSTAVYYLRHYRRKGKNIWPVVEEALTDKSVEVARWALRLMVEDGYAKADQALRKILASGSSELRSHALQHIREMLERDAKKARSYLPLVQQVLRAQDPRIRCDALHTAVALMESGQLAFLRETSEKDKDPAVQETALRCCTVLADPPVQVIELFIIALDSDHEKVRDTAATLLRKGCKRYFAYDAKQPLNIRQAGIKKWEEWYLASRAKLQWHSDLRGFRLPGERPPPTDDGPAKPKAKTP